MKLFGKKDRLVRKVQELMCMDNEVRLTKYIFTLLLKKMHSLLFVIFDREKKHYDCRKRALFLCEREEAWAKLVASGVSKWFSLF